MFTGIIEEVGKVREVRHRDGNVDLLVEARMTPELRVDQSVSHGGVCLTVVEIAPDATWYRVTAIEETLRRTTLGDLRAGDAVDLERCVRMGDRLDGHLVQGHVDTTTTCVAVEDLDGSWIFRFALRDQQELVVHKGSISINGTSLTVAELGTDGFAVAIIPYTFEHTTFRHLRAGHRVNIEFDILGKYVQRMLAIRTH